MKKIKFLAYVLTSFMVLTSYGFSMNVTVTINKLPHKFQGAVFQIVFPHIGTAWSATLEPVNTEQSVPVPYYQDYQNIKIRRIQLGKMDEVSCDPQNFSYNKELKVEVKYYQYSNQFHDGLYCTVTGN